MSRYQEFFSVIGWGNLPPLAASIITKFERFVCERFGNILKRSFKGHKNSEINMLSVLLANMQRKWWGLEMQFNLIMVWFHLKLCTKKRGIALAGVIFFDIFVNADVVNAQTTLGIPLKNPVEPP